MSSFGAFTNFGPSVWNSLPQTVIISDSLFLNPGLKLFCSTRLLPNTDPTCRQRLRSYDRMENRNSIRPIIIPPPLIGAGIKRCFCLTSDVCLSVAYIGRNSRTERPRKTKIGTEIAHVTRDSDTTFKVNRSQVKVTGPLWLVVLAGQHRRTVMVTYPYAYMTYIVSPLAALGGGISWRPPAYSLFGSHFVICTSYTRHYDPS